MSRPGSVAVPFVQPPARASKSSSVLQAEPHLHRALVANEGQARARVALKQTTADLGGRVVGETQCNEAEILGVDIVQSHVPVTGSNLERRAEFPFEMVDGVDQHACYHATRMAGQYCPV